MSPNGPMVNWLGYSNTFPAWKYLEGESEQEISFIGRAWISGDERSDMGSCPCPCPFPFPPVPPPPLWRYPSCRLSSALERIHWMTSVRGRPKGDQQSHPFLPSCHPSDGLEAKTGLAEWLAGLLWKEAVADLTWPGTCAHIYITTSYKYART